MFRSNEYFTWPIIHFSASQFHFMRNFLEKNPHWFTADPLFLNSFLSASYMEWVFNPNLLLYELNRLGIITNLCNTTPTLWDNSSAFWIAYSKFYEKPYMKYTYELGKSFEDFDAYLKFRFDNSETEWCMKRGFRTVIKVLCKAFEDNKFGDLNNYEAKNELKKLKFNMTSTETISLWLSAILPDRERLSKFLAVLSQEKFIDWESDFKNFLCHYCGEYLPEERLSLPEGIESRDTRDGIIFTKDFILWPFNVLSLKEIKKDRVWKFSSKDEEDVVKDYLKRVPIELISLTGKTIKLNHNPTKQIPFYYSYLSKENKKSPQDYEADIETFRNNTPRYPPTNKKGGRKNVKKPGEDASSYLRKSEEMDDFFWRWYIPPK